MTSHYTRESVTTLHDFRGVCWDGLWTLSFGLSQVRGHGPWLMCEVALTFTFHRQLQRNDLSFHNSKVHHVLKRLGVVLCDEAPELCIFGCML